MGLILVSQRPSRVDETILAQCNSLLIWRIVNPRDQSYVKQIMENLDEKDARMLPGFGPGQGIISGRAVRSPLLVQVEMDKDLVYSDLGDENFFQQVSERKPDAASATRESVRKKLEPLRDVPDRGAKKKRKTR